MFHLRSLLLPRHISFFLDQCIATDSILTVADNSDSVTSSVAINSSMSLRSIIAIELAFFLIAENMATQASWGVVCMHSHTKIQLLTHSIIPKTYYDSQKMVKLSSTL